MAKLKEVKDLTDMKFGRWTVLGRAADRLDSRGYRLIYWHCICDCGTERDVDQRRLLSNKENISCGCYQKEVVRISSRNNRTPFKFRIGEKVKTNMGSVTIRGQVRNCSKGNGKYYYYACDICGYENDEEHLISEHTLSNGHGCSCCGGGNAVVKGFNDVATIAPWMIDILKDKEDAYKYGIGSSHKSITLCPDCGFEYPRAIAHIYSQGYRCKRCSDGFKYPEKFMMSVLDQLGIEYVMQLSNKTFKWCNKYKYDFYIPKYNMIIETHGKQHYEENHGSWLKSKTLLDEQENDKHKEKLAIDNNIDYYIVIDCRESSIEWISDSINKSILKDIFDLNIIDYKKCLAFTTKSIVKKVCDYYKLHNNMSTIDLNRVFHLSYGTISKYLKQGTKLGWCNYDANIAVNIGRHKSSKIKELEGWYQDKYIGKFSCINDAIKYIDSTYGIKLANNAISQTCNGIQKTTKGFVFKYIKTN